MVTKERKLELIKQYGKSEKNTGSIEAQVAILTEDIQQLTEHLKEHRKDVPTRRSLLKKVSQRKHLLEYLTKKDYNRYKAIISSLGLRK